MSALEPYRSISNLRFRRLQHNHIVRRTTDSLASVRREMKARSSSSDDGSSIQLESRPQNSAKDYQAALKTTLMSLQGLLNMLALGILSPVLP